MKPLSRRSVTTGLAAAVMAIPAVGLCASRKSDATARVEHHTRELEKAMRDLYGLEVEVLRFEPTDGMVACVLVAANGGETARPAANSRWLCVGQDRTYF